MKIKTFLYFCYINLQILFVCGNWRDQLLDYDIITDFNIRITRSTSPNKRVSLQTKYRKFNLILKPSENLFSHNFKSMNIDKFGRKKPVLIDQSQYYHGYVLDENSSVRAYLGNDRMLSIYINVNDDIFQVESLSRYETNNSSIIIYRYRDLKFNSTNHRICALKNTTRTQNYENNFFADRPKRSVADKDDTSSINNNGQKKLCNIKLVADYRFHQEHGRGDKTRTHNYLIELIDKINELFKYTEFLDSKNNVYIGFGFLIQEILVHVDWTAKSGHYNEKRSLNADAWKVEDLLNMFGDIDHGDFCLAHLFTYQSFSEGTLGLAWIGTSTSYGNGGICSTKVPTNNNKEKSVNTAWSTYKDAYGNHLVSLSAHLVTAHELGHNWGADHDPDTPNCSPNDKGGGKYVMYTYSVIGYEKNNMIFSPCSKRSIGETIAIRAEHCFHPISNSYCGNTRVEDNEDCDVGRNNINDSCCTPDCRFRSLAVCSPFNHECCNSKCQYKSAGENCANPNPLNPCLGSAICDGVNKTCAGPKKLSGPPCTEHGHCVNGECRPFCETLNMEACVCDEIKNACLICCRNKSIGNQECRPYFSQENSTKTLNDGRSCIQGFCEKGICKRRVNKLIERIWKIIENFDTKFFGQFLASFLLDNLVGTVIILSLLLWIPASIMVSCYDTKQRRLLIDKNKSRLQMSFT